MSAAPDGSALRPRRQESRPKSHSCNAARVIWMSRLPLMQARPGGGAPVHVEDPDVAAGAAHD